MCGIVGMLTQSESDEAGIKDMKDALAHRGPDASAVFVSETGKISLGHTRLSIIDLSSAADQPFRTSDGRYVIVFNGEIYNFRRLRSLLENQYSTTFRTSSDTEVIAEGFAVWGCSLAQKLEGMFAIVIADLQLEKLYIFRDRVGKKPLYYCRNKKGFYFASEIKALLQIPDIKSSLTTSRKSIATFLHLGYIPEPDTIYSEIQKFPAGCVGEVSREKDLEIKRFWDLNDILCQPKSESQSDPVDTLFGLLRSSISDRLISDVPLGTFLSGGTDSSLVTAIASTLVSGPIKSFNIGFREDTFDERKYAEAVAMKLKTEHTSYELSLRDAMQLVHEYLDHFDEPFGDTSAIPTMLVSRLARQQVTVALTGDGGDELFQGYGSYTWANRLNSRHWKLLKNPFRAFFDISGNNRMQRISELLRTPQYGGIRSHIFSQEQYFFSQDEIQKRLLIQPDDALIFEYEDPGSIRSLPLTPGEMQALFDFHYYLRDDLLLKVDMSSMHYGLECRCPLLDHNVIEFAFDLPIEYKVRKGEPKWILKELLQRFLPEDLVFRKKRGFSIPLGEWLKKDLHHLIEENLNAEAISSAGLVNYNFVQRLLLDFNGGKDYLYHRIWLLVVLHRWWRIHNR
jgi:asparagine synthase (glutamine-hydrolysing)